MADRPLLLCLMGPTASGKTDLAIALAQQANCELVSVDSALVYRGLDIGSAKPDYPHRLVDIRDPWEPYSAADFCSDARAAIDDILSAGRTPLLVGGTMLYFRALLQGLADMPASDAAVRDEVATLAAREGWPAVHARLRKVDPEAAERIHPNHSQRLGRALEVYLSSGIPLSEWQARGRRDGAGGIADEYRVLQMAIRPASREVLHQRIALRLEQMFDQGFLEEVQQLHARGDLTPDLPAVRAVGYRQLWGYLDGEYDLQQARERCLVATRQLAKRQLTWLRGWQGLRWILTGEDGLAAETDQEPPAKRRPPVDLALNYIRSTPI